MRLPRLAQTMGTTLLDLLYPKRCVGCGQEGRYFCGGCRAVLPWIPSPWCSQCGLHLAPGASCSFCSIHELALDGLSSAFLYLSPIREAIIALKYRGLTALSGELAELLVDHVRKRRFDVDVIVPVPLHRSRQRERGYNQSEVIGRGLGRLLGLPVDIKALSRLRSTAPQAQQASRDERLRNIGGAFAAQKEAAQGQRVLLLDDVCTTGATLNACALALRAGGAQTVWGLTIAREE